MSTRLEAAVVELVEAVREELRSELASATIDRPARLLSITEAAELLGLSRTRLYGELRSGRLRSIHVGRRVLVPSSAIAEFIECRR